MANSQRPAAWGAGQQTRAPVASHRPGLQWGIVRNIFPAEPSAAAEPSARAAAVIARIEGSNGPGATRLDDAQRALAGEVLAFLDAALGAAGQRSLGRIGFYVHGPAGRGKSWIMSELFREVDLPESAKRRIHFHEFFRSFHRQSAVRGSAREAIEHTLTQLFDGVALVYFDELHVHDPGSGALLNRMLEELAARGIPTLITSNYEPEQLLPNPIYHRIVEPGIATIRAHFAVRLLDAGTDYRIAQEPSAHGFASGRWIVGVPHAAHGVGALPAQSEATSVLEGHRALRASAVRGREVWFDFASLIEAPSYSEDFLNLADRFETWVITEVPPLARADEAARQRFVTLIDVLVDRDHRLTVFSEASRSEFVDIDAPPADLFRCASRLALLSE